MLLTMIKYLKRKVIYSIVELNVLLCNTRHIEKMRIVKKMIMAILKKKELLKHVQRQVNILTCPGSETDGDEDGCADERDSQN
mmetsp:Transcript_11572/g.14464  ORF Transcript_11572/g.14464 Transcript_11572/m.14464 type:complete len:83 (-) Transcript_11572:341-589(-)